MEKTGVSRADVFIGSPRIESPNRNGGDHSANLRNVSQALAAKMVSVSPRSIADVARVGAKGTKGLIRAVEDGKIAVSVSAKLADQDEACARASK